jgi:hypothetical protein
MRIRLIAVSAVAGAAMLPACEAGSPASPEAGDTIVVPGFAIGVDRSESAVLTFAGMLQVGTSHLVRTGRGISGGVHTTQLGAGHAVTVWIVIFNEPGQCSPPGCGEDDLFTPEVMTDVVYGAGHVVGGAGVASFATHLSEGRARWSLWERLGLPSPGLLDANKAEIHFVVRDHGPKIPGIMQSMTHTFGGGCNDSPADGSLGVPGPNVCADIQFAVHTP